MDAPEDPKWPDDFEQEAEYEELLAPSELTEVSLPGSFVPVTTEEMSREQFAYLFCMKICARLNEGEDLPFEVNDIGYLVRMVKCTPQVVVSNSLQSKILQLSHFLRLSGHPSGRTLYLTLRNDFYWPVMAIDCYAMERFCTECPKIRFQFRKSSKKLKLFSAR